MGMEMSPMSVVMAIAGKAAAREAVSRIEVPCEPYGRKASSIGLMEVKKATGGHEGEALVVATRKA